MATTTDTEVALSDFRRATIEELGFTAEEAEQLSNSFYDQTVKGDANKPTRMYRIRVDHHYLRRLLERGATRAQVIAMLV